MKCGGELLKMKRETYEQKNYGLDEYKETHLCTSKVSFSLVESFH